MTSQIQIQPKPVLDQIAKRAYDLYLKEGRPVGRALNHWLAAESEITYGGRKVLSTPDRATRRKPKGTASRIGSTANA